MHKFLAAASSVLIQQHQRRRMKHRFYNIAEKDGNKGKRAAVCRG